MSFGVHWIEADGFIAKFQRTLELAIHAIENAKVLANELVVGVDLMGSFEHFDRFVQSV